MMASLLVTVTTLALSVTAFKVSSLKTLGRHSITNSRSLALQSSKQSSGDEGPKDRPFTLPAGQFKPKQSLGQNFLSDQNYVLKICDAFADTSSEGHRVVEIGPGPGALTRVLYQRYPSMTAIEIDQRAVAFLGEKLPGVNLFTNLSIRHLINIERSHVLVTLERRHMIICIEVPFYSTH